MVTLNTTLMNSKFMSASRASDFSVVIGVRNYLKVFKAVVIFYAISMVNPLRAFKNTAEFLLHYNSMFKNIADFISMRMSRNMNLNISSRNLYSASFPIWTKRTFKGESFWMVKTNSFPTLFSRFTSPISPISFLDGFESLSNNLRGLFSTQIKMTHK